MQQIEYPVSINYVSEWGDYQIVREIFTNAYDADPSSFRYYISNGELTVRNRGVIPYEGFLLGESIKADKDKAIGKFGEGMKLAMLVALRNGYGISIRSGNFLAVPYISTMLNREILAIRFEEQPFVEMTTVRITGMQNPEKYLDNFLFVTHPHLNASVELFSEEFTGVYVKGVRLPEARKSLFGYNLILDLSDRDRNNAPYMDSLIGVLVNALTDDRISDEGFLKLVELADDEYAEYYVDYLPSYSLSAARYQYLTKQIVGENAVLSYSDEYDRQATWLGYKVVEGKSPIQRAIYSRIFPYSPRVIPDDFYISQIIPLEELDEYQMRNYFLARKIADIVRFWGEIRVFKNHSQQMNGAYKVPDIYLREDVLDDEIETVNVLIHELAHWYSGGAGDMTSAHIHAISKVGALIFAHRKEIEK